MNAEYSVEMFAAGTIARMDILGERFGEDLLWKRIFDGELHRGDLFTDGSEGIIPNTPLEREPDDLEILR